MKKYYVGYVPKTLRPRLFRSAVTPTGVTHGETYIYVVGPFRTKRGARFMRDYGRNNPHCRCVDEAERLAAHFDARVTR